MSVDPGPTALRHLPCQRIWPGRPVQHLRTFWLVRGSVLCVVVIAVVAFSVPARGLSNLQATALTLNLLFMGVAGTWAATLLSRDARNATTPLPWFLLAACAYFGFGPTVYVGVGGND